MALFGLFGQNPLKESAFAIYGVVGEHARRPEFFTDWAVKDTFDGRFDLLVLHLHLAVRRLRSIGTDNKKAQQHLFDVFMNDLDQGLRLEGVGDIGIGHRVKKMTHAYYGRAVAYDAALDDDSQDDLAAALHRNLYRAEDVPEDVLASMADYVRAQSGRLDAISDQDFMRGAFGFDVPQGGHQ